MKPHRIQVRFLLDAPDAFTQAHVVPVFHRWIQNGRTDELLLDVADYRHVHRGPGIVLVGHEADYAVDSADGQLGFRYTRKRDLPGGFSASAAQAIAAAASGVRFLLEDLVTAHPAVRAGGFDLTVIDALQYPNTDASLGLVAERLEPLFTLAGLGAPRISHNAGDPRGPLTVRVETNGVTDVRAYEAALHPILATEELHAAA